MTPMFCLTFYRINSAKKGKETDGKRIARLALLARPISHQISIRGMYARVSPSSRFVAADGDEVEPSMVGVLPFCMYGSFRNGAGGSIKRLAVHASL